MITVHPPAVSGSGRQLRVTARVEGSAFGSTEVWFDAESTSELRLSESSEAFAAAVLPLAWNAGIPMHVRGVVSPRFAWGLREFVRMRRAWWPRPIPDPEIHYDRIEEPIAAGKGVGCGFSGGVDSFFTLLRHRPGGEALPGFSVTHLVIIVGFDQDVERGGPGLAGVLRRIYEPMADEIGVDLVIVRTNLMRLPGRYGDGLAASWIGSELTAPALALSPMFRRYYLASGGRGYDGASPLGTSPLTDHLFSSDTMQVIHDGADQPRHRKLEAVADWPVAAGRLRVCRIEGRTNVDFDRGVVVNCGRCDKCMRTLGALAAMGKLDRFHTFARPFTTRSLILNGHSYLGSFYDHQMMAEAFRRGRIGLGISMAARVLLVALRRSASLTRSLLRRRSGRAGTRAWTQPQPREQA